VWFYAFSPWRDPVIAIIALTVTIRVVLFPLLWKAQRAQKALSALQPEIKKIQQDFKHNREAQGKALIELYQNHRVNPFSGCLMMVIQLPILFALFGVFKSGFDPESLSFLYSSIPHPGELNPVGLWGLLDVSKGNIPLGVIAAATQYFSTKLTVPPPTPSADNDFARAMSVQMQYVLPAIILVSSFSLPAALTLYWTMMNILGIVQELIAKRVGRSRT